MSFYVESDCVSYISLNIHSAYTCISLKDIFFQDYIRHGNPSEDWKKTYIRIYSAVVFMVYVHFLTWREPLSCIIMVIVSSRVCLYQTWNDLICRVCFAPPPPMHPQPPPPPPLPSIRPCTCSLRPATKKVICFDILSLNFDHLSIGDESLFKPMMTQFNDEYIPH